MPLGNTGKNRPTRKVTRYPNQANTKMKTKRTGRKKLPATTRSDQKVTALEMAHIPDAAA